MMRTPCELEERLNAKAYEMLKSEILEKHQGQYVAIAKGRLLAVSYDFDQALEKIKEIAPDCIRNPFSPRKRVSGGR